MLWPNLFLVLDCLIHDQGFPWWLVGVMGIGIALLLHQYDKTCRLWPAIPALILWFISEIAAEKTTDLWNYAIFFGCFSFCYAWAWVIADLIYRLKAGKGK